MPPKKGRPPKPKPLTQKAEKEMMGQEDIASTAIELTEAQKRMAKAREAKKAKAVAPKKEENITLKIDEAPYGFTASGRKRSKPLKEKAPKAPKKLPKINDPNFETKMKKLQEQLAEAPPPKAKAPKAKAPKAPKAKKVYPPPSVNATAREQIGMIEEDLDAREREKDARQRKKDNPTDLPIKPVRRYIQLLFKGKDTLQDLMYQSPTWTQDGYYTTSGEMDYTEIQDEIARLYSNWKDTFDEAVKWFGDAYDGKSWKKPNELVQRDRHYLTYEYFGLEENRNYKEPDDEDYNEDDEEFNGEYILSDWNDFEEGLEGMESSLKTIIVELEKGGFMGSIGWSPSSSEASSPASSPASSRSSSASSVGTARWDEGSPSSSRSSSRSSSGYGLEGGALSAKELKGLLGASYNPKIDKVGDFVLDSKLSTSTSKVYRNPNTAQVVVAHRGTEGLLDWGNNAVYALGGKTAYKMTPRYKEAEKVQKQAEKKYGKENVSTIGHSQGGLQAELLGGKSKEIITLNKATRPFESNKNKNQTDVRSGRDVVSALNPFEKKSSKNIEIQGETYNPLAEHSGDVLDRLEENQMIGEGIRRMIEGGATEAQRSMGSILRSRLSREVLRRIPQDILDKYLPKVDVPKSTKLGQTINNGSFESLLNHLTHSADFGSKLQAHNPYTDYEDRDNYVVPAQVGRNQDGLIVKTPQELIEIALDAWFGLVWDKYNQIDPANLGKKGEWLLGNRETATIPAQLKPYWEQWKQGKRANVLPTIKMGKKGKAKIDLDEIKRRKNIVGKLGAIKAEMDAEEGERGGMGEEEVASTKREQADKAEMERKRRIVEEERKRKEEEAKPKPAPKAEAPKAEAKAEAPKAEAWWSDPYNDRYERLSVLFDKWFHSVRLNNRKEEADNRRLIIRFYQNTLLPDIESFKQKYGGLTPDLFPLAQKPAGVGARLPRLDPKTNEIDLPPMDADPRRNGAFNWINPLPYLAKTHKYFVDNRLNIYRDQYPPKVKGKGLGGGAIDFEDMNWGSLTEQMKAYNSQHSKDLDLEGFARMIVADPSKFQKKTLQRARFYLNVLLPKKKK